MKDKVKVGSVAPGFALPSQAGEMVSLEDFLGRKPVVMVFQHYKEQIP
jgi:peroxiredoxin